MKTEITQMLVKSGKNLAQIVASSSFDFWKRADFRLYVNFKGITQTEQDRMFNELEVSLLGLFALHLDHVQSNTQGELKLVLKTLQKELVAGFLALFFDLDVEEKYVHEWQQLIDLRFDEYRRDFKAALKESESLKEFKGDEELRIAWARTETITIDCLTHIRRGEVEEKDPLWKLLQKWFITLDASLNPILDMSQKNSSAN